MRRWPRVLGFLTLFAAVGVASAEPPENMTNALQYARDSQPVWCTKLVLDADTTTKPVNVGLEGSAGLASAVPVVFGWGTRVQVTATAKATFCFTLSTTVTIGSQAAATNTANQVKDTSQSATQPSGGACVTLNPAGGFGSAIMVPNYRSLTQTWRPGYRAGICSAVQAPQVDVVAHIPSCAVVAGVGTDADCTDAGVSGGTCSAITTKELAQKRQTAGGAFMVSKSLTANNEALVCIVR